MKSKLQQFSLGAVVDGYDIEKLKDKETRDEEITKSIEIYPIEHLSQLDGDLSDVDVVTLKVKDLHNNRISNTITKQKTLSCHWVAMGKYNRVTPPIVNKGETVMIYRYADTDEFYWDSLFIADDLRQGEYVGHKWYSTYEKSYDLIIDGLNNVVTFTSPEKAPYKFKYTIDAEKGIYSFNFPSELGEEFDNHYTMSDGGTKLRTNIAEEYFITTDAYKLYTSTIDLKGEVTSANEITIMGLPVYASIVALQSRVAILEQRVNG